MRTRLTAALALLTAVLLGLVGLAPAQAAAGQIPGVVAIQPGSLEVGGVWSSTVLTDPESATRDGYQWLRDGQPVPGATGPTYTATPADVGHTLSLRVVVSATGFLTTSLVSPAIGGIEAADPFTDGADQDTFDAYRPVIAGKARVGQTVRVETDPEDYDETTTLAYQWLLGGKPAKKGTGVTFKLKKKHRGMVLSVQVTASAPDYETETVTSRPKKVKR